MATITKPGKMFRRIEVKPEIFEVFDGGHCYLRAKRDHEGYITIERFPVRADADEIAAMGVWASATPAPPTTKRDWSAS